MFHYRVTVTLVVLSYARQVPLFQLERHCGKIREKRLHYYRWCITIELDTMANSWSWFYLMG